MKKPSEDGPPPAPLAPPDPDNLRQRLIGLGEHSIRKSHYPQLQERLAELERSEARYRRLFENSPAGHFVSDADGALLDCNPAFARTFGFESPAEARRISLIDLYLAPADRDRFLGLLREKRLLTHHEMPMRHRDGRPLWVQINAEGRFDAEGRLTRIYGFLSDHTQRREMEAQFRQAQKMEAVGRLAASVAHDFNNMMTAVKGYAELLTLKLADAPDLAEYARQIVEAVRRATGLISQLLAFSRRQTPHPTLLNLNRLVTDMADMFRQVLGRSIALETRLDPSIGRVMADPGQMEQVLMNLMVNARDAIGAGSGRVRVRTGGMIADIPESGKNDRRYVFLQVRDSGAGMDARTQARLFEPFFTTKQKGKGTGLGLSTVYGIIKSNKGHIRVRSRPGAGATFTILLPETTRTAEVRAKNR